MPEPTSEQSQQKPTLAPGMVMGPDGKPCKVCTAFRHWKPGSQAVPTKSSKEKSNEGKTLTVEPAVASAVVSASTATRPDVPPAHCPPDVEQLGRATWTFLHTTAAYYPERPTPTQRANMLMLLRSLPLLYPCSNCADDFGENMKSHPPDVSGRVGLSRWLCERHNEVNSKLGKEMFDCAKTDERWKDGPADGSCD